MRLGRLSWWLSGKESAYQSSIPRVGRSLGEENGNSTPAFLPGKFHGQSSLVGYSALGHKELDMTK